VPPQQQAWVQDETWDLPPRPRNNALYDSQPGFVGTPLGQDVAVELQGVVAGGHVGELQAHAVSNAALSGATMGMGTGRPELTEIATPEARFEALQARVALLEAGLAALRSDDRQIGPGHNRGPEFTPVEDLSDVDGLIALPKEQGPRPPTDPTPLIEQGEKALQVSEKILNAAKTVGTEMAKGAAREVGKKLLEWIGFAQLIKDLYLAFKDWLG